VGGQYFSAHVRARCGGSPDVVNTKSAAKQIARGEDMAATIIIVGLYLLVTVLLGVTLCYTRPRTWKRDTALLMITPLAVPVVYAIFTILNG
jgi:hypothetical protein